MATSKMIIIRTIAAFLPQLPVSDAAELRRVAEWKIAERALTWEEWLDVRDEWAKYYEALVVTMNRGDTTAFRLAAEQAANQNYKTILLEYV